MDDDKITDDEIDALDGVDLLELGQKFLDNGDGQRALKCFLRAGEPDKSVFSRLMGLSIAAEIYRNGLGGVPVDGRKALNYYKRIVKTIFGTLDIDSLDEDEKFKRILADGQNGNFAFEALGEIETMYGYGEAGVRCDDYKALHFAIMAFYVGHGYLDDENYRSWRRKNDERTTD